MKKIATSIADQIQWEGMPISSEQFTGLLEKILFSLFLFILGILLARISTRLINRFFKTRWHKDDNPILVRRTNTLQSISVSFARYSIYFCMGYIILYTFTGGTIQSLLTVAGVGGIVIGLGAQSLVEDIIAGFFIIFEDHYAVGDIVTIGGVTGTVTEIGIRTTHIRSYNGDYHVIPNGSIGAVSNLTHEFQKAEIVVKVSYQEPVARVMAILEDEMAHCLEAIDALTKKPEILGVSAFHDFSYDILILAECEIRQNWMIERQMRQRILARFELEQIQRPMPDYTKEDAHEL